MQGSLSPLECWDKRKHSHEPSHPLHMMAGLSRERAGATRGLQTLMDTQQGKPLTSFL